MILSDLPTPAEASTHNSETYQGVAQAGNRFPLFGIMLYAAAECPAAWSSCGGGPVMTVTSTKPAARS
jgi:hypothetical protein